MEETSTPLSQLATDIVTLSIKSLRLSNDIASDSFKQALALTECSRYLYQVSQQVYTIERSLYADHYNSKNGDK